MQHLTKNPDQKPCLYPGECVQRFLMHFLRLEPFSVACPRLLRQHAPSRMAPLVGFTLNATPQLCSLLQVHDSYRHDSGLAVTAVS